MKVSFFQILAVTFPSLESTPARPKATDQGLNVTYQGLYRDQVEAFLSIPFGQDTAGVHRFKPPRPFVPEPKSTFIATDLGPACPQALGAIAAPLYLSNITNISEDCLHLNIYRPNGTKAGDKLPVLVYIHGGSFVLASKDELVSQPGGLILQSIENGHPIMHVSINYRMGVFGFAQSAALKRQRSENAGLKDQRLGLEWVQRNIAWFGGDPGKVTIHGQSSGGLSVGMQILAYGAAKPVPFQQAICQSQALEPGITGDFTRKGMKRLLNASPCNNTALDSVATVSCLRSLPMDSLLRAQLDTWANGPGENIGDCWLPVVDHDIVPAAPSDLLAQGRFANVSAMIGWCEDDTSPFTTATIATQTDTYSFHRQYLPGFTEASLETLLALYPPSKFHDNPSANLSSEFYRASRILRDILMVCQSMYVGDALAGMGNDVYYFDQNQTFLGPALSSIGKPGQGVVHTSDFAYMFGNLSHFDVNGYPFLPDATDYALLVRESRSWASFVALGNPSPPGKKTLQGWRKAYQQLNETDIYVIGGPYEGLSAQDGPRGTPAVSEQRLRERCAFINRPDIIRQIQY